MGFFNNKEIIRHNQRYPLRAYIFCNTGAFLYKKDTNALPKTTASLRSSVSLHTRLLDNLSSLKLSVPVSRHTMYTAKPLSSVCGGRLWATVCIVRVVKGNESPPINTSHQAWAATQTESVPPWGQKCRADQRVYEPFGYVECQCKLTIQRDFQLSHRDESAPVCILLV